MLAHLVEKADALWSWTALSSNNVLVLTFSLLVPAAVAGAICREQVKLRVRRGRGVETTGLALQGGNAVHGQADGAGAGVWGGSEPWSWRLEVKDWQQAGQFPGCPWSFDGCESVEDVLRRIWRMPLSKHLSSALDALESHVQAVRIARSPALLAEEVHFAVIYTLSSGAELFGGAPLEHAVGLELGDSGCEPGMGTSPPWSPISPVRRDGLRRRRGESSPKSPVSEAAHLPLPCLAPFYRIHDGFGVLLSTDHLPVLLSNPSDSVQGSCFYAYPVRALEPVARRASLIRFARVDRHCVACADGAAERPCVVYVERSGEQLEDDEVPLAFLADTVRNVAGRASAPPQRPRSSQG